MRNSFPLVYLNATRIGYEAAWLLNEMMNGEASPNETILITPLRVVNRQSTDITAVKDLDLAAALTFIRQHACGGITVGDVVKQVSLSRATLVCTKDSLWRKPDASYFVAERSEPSGSAAWFATHRTACAVPLIIRPQAIVKVGGIGRKPQGSG